jgi:hypothetical protein
MAHFNRRPRGYDGTGLTTHRVADLLPRMLSSLGDVHNERPDLILACWPEIIGQKMAPMTEAVSFVQGVLLIKVTNATLYSLLSQHEKPRIVARLKSKFPGVHFKNVLFRRG